MTEWIPVAAPTLKGNERRYVDECLETTWISSNGSYIQRFEQQFAAFCEMPRAISCSNGTVALHVALLGLGVGPGDEVLVPSLTYVATANAVRYCQATPVFVDSDRETWNLNPKDIERKVTRKTKAIIAVHLYGRPAPMAEIMAIAHRHDLKVVEDAAEAHGARYHGRMIGSLGDIATFSFYGNKIITCGEGGMILTRNQELDSAMRIFKGQGQDPNRRYWHPVIGFNYRMTNIAAAIGLAQLEQIDAFLEARDEIRLWYEEELVGVPGLRIPTQEEDERSVTWIFSVVLENVARGERDAIMAAMAAKGVETRPFFYPIHSMPPYADGRGLDPDSTAEWLSARGLSLPTWIGMERQHVQRVCAALEESLAAVIRR